MGQRLRPEPRLEIQANRRACHRTRRCDCQTATRSAARSSRCLACGATRTARRVRRFHPPARGRLTWPNIRLGATLAWNVVTRVGIKSDYRDAFWGTAWPAIKRGQIEAVLGMGFTSHHLIQFSREALRGEQNASFYSARSKTQAEVGERAMADA